MADLERLVVQLSADIKKYENALNKANGITNKQARSIENRFAKMNKSLGTSFASVGRAAVGAFAGSAIVAGAAKFSQAATRIDNSLKVAGLSGANLEKVYGDLRDSALRNAAPFESLVELYSRAALIQNELGVSSQQLVQFTDNVALALRVSGKSAQESSGALLQLSQALGSGVVRAEEFNSIVEGAPTILQAAAAGIKEAEGSVAKLRQIMLDGNLSSRALFDGIAAGSSTLAERVQGTELTFDRAMENMQTALIDTAKEFNVSTGASARFARGIDNVATAVANFDVSGFLSKLASINSEFESFLGTLGNADVFTKLNQAMGLMDENGRAINPDLMAANDKVSTLEREVQNLQAVIAKNTRLGFDTTEALARLAGVQSVLNQLRNQAANLPATLPNPSMGDALQPPPRNPDRVKDDDIRTFPVTPISLADPKYAVPDDGKGKKTGGGSKSKGVPRTADDRINSGIQQIRDRTEALRLETELVGKSFEVQEKRKMALDLEQSTLADLREEARRKGETDLSNIKLSAEQVAQIDAVSAAYARQADELRRVQETQDRAEEAAAEFYDTFRSGVVDAITGAESLSDALSGILKKLGEMLLNSAFDALFAPPSSNSSGGMFGAIFGGLGKAFDQGGYTGSGGKYQPAGVVHKGEFVMNAEATRRIGVDNLRKLQGYANGGLVGAPRMPNLQATGGSNAGVNVTFSPVIDNRGASVEAVDRMQIAMEKQSREFEARVVQTVRRAQKTRNL